MLFYPFYSIIKRVINIERIVLENKFMKNKDRHCFILNNFLIFKVSQPVYTAFFISVWSGTLTMRPNYLLSGG